MDNQALPERKRLRLEHFDYRRGGGYFLTICTQSRKELLSQIKPNPVGEGNAKWKMTRSVTLSAERTGL